MAKRDRQKRKLARLRKELLRRPLPAYIDLVHWLKIRGHAQTTGEAMRLIADGRVRSDSHPVGLRAVNVLRNGVLTVEKQPTRLVEASLKPTLLFIGKGE